MTAFYNRDRFSNVDTNNLLGLFVGRFKQTLTDNVYQSAQFKEADLDDDLSFRFNKIRTGLSNPMPIDKESATRLSELTQSLREQHNNLCESETTEKDCMSLATVNKVMANSNDATKLHHVWLKSLQAIAPMRLEFAEKVNLNNLGAQRVGYENMAELRTSRFYQMPAVEFTKELDRVWEQISPLYESLQCHVKAKLADKYGTDIVQQNMPIPAHLTGSLSGSSFANLYTDVMPKGSTIDRGYDLTEKLISAGYTEVDLMRTAEKLSTSMGLPPYDESFYKESIFKKPDAYNISCQSGHWILPESGLSRLVKCNEVTGKDFILSYNDLATNDYSKGAFLNQPDHSRYPPDAFRFAVESAYELLVSPTYLKEISLIDDLPSDSEDIGFLMKQALNDVSVIPFNILVDKWLFAVYSGKLPAKDYNNYWWQLRQQYQGIAPETSNRTDNNMEQYFDAGIVSAVINNRNLSLNAVSKIAKYQIHKNICDAAGNTNLLSRCSTYNSKDAGNKLKALFALGSSKTWSKTLAIWADEKELDGSAMVEYYAPLQAYLDQQNKGLTCGI
jgi:peptidyl-dipeptidase A